MAKWDVDKINAKLAEIDQVDDVVEKPTHYAQYTVEPITFIMGNEMSFWRGNLVKYASRAGFKMYAGKTREQSEITDLRKVQRYCEMRINEILKKEVL